MPKKAKTARRRAVAESRIPNGGNGGNGIQALNNVFCVDKIEDSGMKFFGSNCEHSPGAGRRLEWRPC